MRQSLPPGLSGATTRTGIQTTCRSSEPRVVRAANRDVVSCPMSPRTGRCANWSPTPAGAPGWIGDPTRVSVFPAGPTFFRSPAQCPSRRAFATPVAPRPARHRLIRVDHRTAPRGTRRMARPCSPACRRVCRRIRRRPIRHTHPQVRNRLHRRWRRHRHSRHHLHQIRALVKGHQ